MPVDWACWEPFGTTLKSSEPRYVRLLPSNATMGLTLDEKIRKLRSLLHEPKAPFGVDLLIPQVGGSARKTNYDYSKGKLGVLVDLMIEEKIALFVCAVGVPPKWVVDRLHQAGIFVMNVRASVNICYARS